MCCNVVNAGSVDVSMFGQLDSPFDNMFYDDALVISRTLDSVTMTGPFTQTEMISHLPNSVRFICHNGAAIISISLPALREESAYERGGIIDEAALVRGLDSGKISSVGLDVSKRSPPYSRVS